MFIKITDINKKVNLKQFRTNSEVKANHGFTDNSQSCFVCMKSLRKWLRKSSLYPKFISVRNTDVITVRND